MWRYELDGWFVEELGRLVELERCRLESLDLSGAQLEILRFFHVQIDDCRFDRARCQDWRMSAVDVTDTSFEGADLRSSAPGAWHQEGATRFRSSRALETVRAGVRPAATWPVEPSTPALMEVSMGTWGAGPFDGDTASDVLDALVPMTPDERLERIAQILHTGTALRQGTAGRDRVLFRASVVAGAVSTRW